MEIVVGVLVVGLWYVWKMMKVKGDEFGLLFESCWLVMLIFNVVFSNWKFGI